MKRRPAMEFDPTPSIRPPNYNTVNVYGPKATD